MPKRDYESLSQELELVLEKLQNPNLHVDKTIALYEEGLKLITELEKQLKTAETKLTKLKLNQPST